MDGIATTVCQLFLCILCVGVEPLKIGDKNCDSSLGLHSPIFGGQCPRGTMWSEPDKCCKKCIYCPPGQRKAVDGCLSSCVPCEEGYFSQSTDMAATCQPCSQCGEWDLVTLMSCHRDQDALCGDCPPGFYNVSSRRPVLLKQRSSDETRGGCIPCQEHITVPECSVHFQLYYKAKALEQKSGNTSSQAVIIILSLCTVIGVAFAVIIALLCYNGNIVWKKLKREKDSFELEEQKKTFTEEITRPEREQGDGSNAEGTSAKVPFIIKEDPCGTSQQDFPHMTSCDTDDELQSASASNPHLLGTPSHSGSRSVSMPSLNHITVTIQVPVSIIPELVKCFPSVINTITTSVAGADRLKAFVQE